jgi:hypothetical protein
VAEAARAAGKNIGADVREMGEVTLALDDPERTTEQHALAERAVALLREEVERVERMRAQYAEERRQGAPGTPSPRLDGMAARLEGASRFALRMGLITPGEARLVWAAAMRSGVHDRPATGQPGDPTEQTQEGTR